MLTSPDSYEILELCKLALHSTLCRTVVANHEDVHDTYDAPLITAGLLLRDI